MKGNHATRESAKEAVMSRVHQGLRGGRTIYEFDDGSYALEPWDNRPFSWIDDEGTRRFYLLYTEYRPVLTFIDGIGRFTPVKEDEP